MTKNIVTLSILLTFSVFAKATDASVDANINLGKVAANLQISGQGSWVCSAEDSMNDVPVLGRGQTELEAKAVALQQCAKAPYNNSFFCGVIECDRDKKSGVLSAFFDITRDTTNISINFRGKSRYACYVNNTMRNKIYIAKAATQTEAKAIVKSTCAIDEGQAKSSTKPDGFFCDVDVCEKISGVSGGIKIGDIIGGLIKN